ATLIRLNEKVTPEGRVKLLDIGLAKALASESAVDNPASSPTLTMRATVTGVIMGTAGYMAPEQARGQSVDKRIGGISGFPGWRQTPNSLHCFRFERLR